MSPEASAQAGSTRRELLRQALHFAAGLPVFLLPYLTRGEAAWLVAAAILFNLLAFPRLPGLRGLVRPGEGPWQGIGLYPIVVLGLILGLPHYPALAAAAWAILATGDAASGAAGTLWGARSLPWNGRKSWVGLGAFIVATVPWTTAVLVHCGVSGASALVVAALATVTAAWAETLPLPLDDNLTVAGVSACVLVTSYPLVA